MVVAHGGSRVHEAGRPVAPTRHKVSCLLALIAGLALVVCGAELLISRNQGDFPSNGPTVLSPLLGVGL